MVNPSHTTIKNNDVDCTNISITSLLFKPSANLSLLFNQFNNFSPEQKNEPENDVNSNYYDIDKFQTLKFHEKNKSLSLFLINACSLSKNFADLQHLLKCTNKVFDIIAVNHLYSNINLQNYSFEFTRTESNIGRTLLCIANQLSYKPCTDLSLNKANQLESPFISTINSRKSNIIAGCLHEHPNMDVSDLIKTISTLFLIIWAKNRSNLFFSAILILTY